MTATSEIFIKTKTLGDFQLVRSLYYILRMVIQTLENHLRPEASHLFQRFVADSKAYLISSFKTNGWALVAVLILLFIVAKEVMVLAGDSRFESNHFIINGMSVLYTCILLGYPVFLAIRLKVLHQTFFAGYILAFAFSMLIYKFLLTHFLLWGALTGLVTNQLIMLTYWNKTLASKQFILWK